MNSDLKKLPIPSKNIIYLIAIVGSLVLGGGSGYLLASSNKTLPVTPGSTTTSAKNPQSDTQTFRDFAEGTITKKPASSTTYDEGSELLVRDGASPVALTSSVVDLTQYEGKKVKVYGETQKALKQGWLMDVGRVVVE